MSFAHNSAGTPEYSCHRERINGRMDCNVSSCQFRLKHKGGRHANSLIAMPMEIGRALADHGGAKFSARGSCMYPCVQPGDILHIESRPIEDIEVGDIAVVRHNGFLYGHRTIAKGIDDDGHYIIARPDRNSQDADNPTHKEDLLGVVNKIERKGKEFSTAPKPLSSYAIFRLSIWKLWNRDARRQLIKVIERIQGLQIYQRIASLFLKTIYDQLRYEAHVPLKPGQSHDLYRTIPLDRFELSKSFQQGKPIIEWTLTAYLDATNIPAAWVTLILTPDGCPRGKGWHIDCLHERIRYRGAGLSQVVVNQAANILKQSDMTIKPEA